MSVEINQNREQLAILGAQPAFTEPFHVGSPNLGDRKRFLDRVGAVLDRRWLTNDGQLVQEFEAKIAEQAGVEHCVALANGTVALELLVRSLGLSGEVVVPSFTFIASAHALRWHGITPVFGDIEEDGYNLDPAEVARLITPRTTGILGVHVWGVPCQVERLQAIADRHEVPLILDAAHAFGCSHDDRSVGSFGRAEVFSFHATKFINALEGGAVVTNDGDLAAELQKMRNFGFSDGEVRTLGINAKMSEMSAAMGLTTLESMESIIARNRENYDVYRAKLESVPGLSVIEFDSADTVNYQYVVVRVDESVAGLSRDQVLRVLHAENVLARNYFHPGCHRTTPYCREDIALDGALPNTDVACEQVVVLPTGTAIDVDVAVAISAILEQAIQQSAMVREVLSAERRP